MNSNPLVALAQILFFLVLGAPILAGIFAPMVFMGTLGSLFDRDRFRIDQVVSADDIAFGGDAKKLLSTYKRLRAASANPGDARISNKSLSVAIVEVSKDRLQDRAPSGLGILGNSTRTTRPIEVSLKEAGDGAVLLVADRPVMWQPVGVRASHRAKIAIEGNAVFDLLNAPQGLLAGFRVGAYGAHDTTDPRDLGDSAPKKGLYRFCSSMRVWAEQFNVEMGDIRVFRFKDPSRIAVVGDRLTDSSARRMTPDYVSDICQSNAQSGYRIYMR